MKLALILAVLFALAGCGGSDDDAGGTTSGTTTELTSAEVAAAFKSDLESGSGSRVVDLDSGPPKVIECAKAQTASGWECRVEPGKGGRTVLCTIEVDPTSKTVTKRVCAPVDY